MPRGIGRYRRAGPASAFGSLAAATWSQSRRGGADVRTRNWPDARLRISLANKKQRSESDRGLVSVFEKTKRISGVSWGHAGSHRKLDAHPDRRSHDRRGYFVFHADYGCWNQVRG